MKSLLAILVVGSALGFGYWKTQHPDASLDDMRGVALDGVDRIKGGFAAIRDGGAKREQAKADAELMARQAEEAAAKAKAEAEKTAQASAEAQAKAEKAAALATAQAEEQEVLAARLKSMEAELAEGQKVADPSAVASRLNNAESTLKATLTELNDTRASITTMQSELDNTQGELDSARTELDTARTELDTTKTALNTAVQRLDASETGFATLQASLSSMQADSQSTPTELATINSRLDLLNRRVEEQATQFKADSINEKLDELNAQVSALQDTNRKNAREQASSIAGMEEKLESFEARLNTLSTDTSQGQEAAAATINAQIDQRLAVLEKKLDTTNADSRKLQSMADELSASNEKIAQIERQFGQTDEQLGSLNRSMQELRTKTESNSIDDLQSRISAQLVSLQNQIELSDKGGSDNVQALNSELGATRARLNELEQRVVDLPAASVEADAAVQAQSALEQQIAALETRISTIDTGPDDTLVNTISEVQEKVSELSSKAFVTREDLAAVQENQKQEARNVEYKIYFDRNSVAITEEAAKVLNSFIAQEKNRTTGVSIYGFTDRRGSAVYNQQLALQRATNVRSYIIQNGFDFTKINSVSGLGEDAAATKLDDGEEDANQRSVVLFAAQP